MCKNTHKSQYRSFCWVFLSVAVLFCSQDKQSLHLTPLSVCVEPANSESLHTTPSSRVKELLSYAGLPEGSFIQSDEQCEFGVTSIARAGLMNKMGRHKRLNICNNVWIPILNVAGYATRTTGKNDEM